MLRGVVMALGLAVCACIAPPEAAPIANEVTHAPTSKLQPGWRYRVKLDASGEMLDVEGALVPGSDDLGVDAPALPYLEKVEVDGGRGWHAARKEKRRWRADGCTGHCRIRYRFALGRAASELNDVATAARRAGTLLSPPSAWLLRPERGDGVSYSFRVETPPGIAFVTGIWPDAREPGAFGGDAGDLWRSPYSAFGRFHQARLHDGAVEIALAPGVDEKLAHGWLNGAAATVGEYFGRFPVPRVLVLVVPSEGARVHGTQMGGGGASILLTLGHDAGRAELARDWVAVHEMVHLGVPSMPRHHLWLTEGLATYIEPMARARRGELNVVTVWRGMVWGMPHGLPAAGDRGLDRTPTWGRIYWGGALFALLADIEIRKRTQNARSLDDGLRAVVARGGHNGAWWPIDRFVKVADEGTGTTVLAELYGQMADKPHAVDLPALWAELGIVGRGQSLRFDDRAPLAHIRRALTAPTRQN
jgi:hypothetical protein